MHETGPFSIPAIRDFVPPKLRPWIIIAFVIVFQFSQPFLFLFQFLEYSLHGRPVFCLKVMYQVQAFLGFPECFLVHLHGIQIG